MRPIEQRRMMACARRAVYVAVRYGRLPRVKSVKCVDCGDPAAEYDHFLGYAKEHRLNVEPVCLSCHRKRGFRRGEIKRFYDWTGRKHSLTTRLKMSKCRLGIQFSAEHLKNMSIAQTRRYSRSAHGK